MTAKHPNSARFWRRNRMQGLSIEIRLAFTRAPADPEELTQRESATKEFLDLRAIEDRLLARAARMHTAVAYQDALENVMITPAGR